MFVCLWSPAWRTVADSLADLSPALLTVTPRVVTEERRGGLVWVDARGLDAEHVARSALEVLRGLGLSNVHVGVGKTAIVAELIAVSGIGNRESGIGTTSGCVRSRFPIPDSRFPVIGSHSNRRKIRTAFRHLTSAISSLVRPITSRAHSLARPVQRVMSAPQSSRVAPTAA